MSRFLLCAVVVGAVLLGAPGLDNADITDLNLATASPGFTNWALLGVGLASIGLAKSSKRKDGRIAV
jgi:hypothetical protein